MRETIEKILLDHPKIESFTPQSNLLKDFDLSSLDIADIMVSIEDELDIEIDDSDLMKLKTVQDIYDYVDAL